jgi:hypothetical protein
VWLLTCDFQQINHYFLLSAPLLVSQAIHCLWVVGCYWDSLYRLYELLNPTDCDKRSEQRNAPHYITNWHPSIEWKSSDIAGCEAS